MLENTTLPSEVGESDLESRVPALIWLFPSSTVHELAGASKVIGRDADCAIRVESQGVSRKHAEIYRQGPVFAIKDLGSRNGVFVEGRRIEHTALRPGQVLRIGDHIALFSSLAREKLDIGLGFDEVASGLFGGEKLAEALRLLPRAAKDVLPIIIQGETGTGKELVARNIHRWSGRTGPFYAVNCAAIPEAMIEGELFGYRRGAFTGAAQGHLGHVRAAHGGTLFLDEVSDLPLGAQAKLLRVLEQGEVVPLGENVSQPVDLHVVCATQGSLRLAVERGAFRPDLFARLSGYTCVLPALRDRREDVVGLFGTFLHRLSGGRPPRVDAKLIEQLCLYRWPHNVRELSLLSRSLLVLHGETDVLKREFLPPEITSADIDAAPNATDRIGRTAPADRGQHDLERLVAELKRNDGNLARSAASAGISRQRAYRLIDGRSISELLGSPCPDVVGEDDGRASERS
ncbi:MAG TPA: sigma 54-interacting transcriptional regulator [Polyangiaceae bacterium]|nr:sigma 54-interacting transcriptional regulator [Polyangiaceae bacterium]